jgi:ABC-type amino acid transport substrate-binding protein
MHSHLPPCRASIASAASMRSGRRQIERESMNRSFTLSRVVAGMALLWALTAATGCSGDQKIRTLRPGVLTVAVTSGAPTNQYDPQLWIRRYVEQFAAEHELTIAWIVVPFNESWLLASSDEVDLVATNVASFADRAHSGATFSAPFLYERRALRIRPEDQGRYEHINDFIGKTVGVVSGMAAERDVTRRAPDGVIVKTAATFVELYAEFDAGKLDAIAEAEYYALDGEVIPSHGNDVFLIDHHDLTPGQREESVFVVCDASENLLAAVNAFIARTRFPL